jgi:type IV secretory pathway VirB4 component
MIDKTEKDIKHLPNDSITVLSGGKGDIVFHYMLSHFAETIKLLKGNEAKFKEINRIISGLGADKSACE